MITDIETVRHALLDFKLADHYVVKIVEEIELRTTQTNIADKGKKYLNELIALLASGIVTYGDLTEDTIKTNHNEPIKETMPLLLTA